MAEGEKAKSTCPTEYLNAIEIISDCEKAFICLLDFRLFGMPPYQSPIKEVKLNNLVASIDRFLQLVELWPTFNCLEAAKEAKRILPHLTTGGLESLVARGDWELWTRISLDLEGLAFNMRDVVSEGHTLTLPIATTNSESVSVKEGRGDADALAPVITITALWDIIRRHKEGSKIARKRGTVAGWVTQKGFPKPIDTTTRIKSYPRELVRNFVRSEKGIDIGPAE